MILLELFTKPLPFKVIEDGPTILFAEFKDSNGVEYEFEANLESNRIWSIMFVVIKKEGKFRLPSFNQTNFNQPIPIFSTIAHLISMILKQKNANGFVFTADELDQSRVKLYRRLSKRLAREIGFVYQEDKREELEHYIFLIAKPNIQVDINSLLQH